MNFLIEIFSFYYFLRIRRPQLYLIYFKNSIFNHKDTDLVSELYLRNQKKTLIAIDLNIHNQILSRKKVWYSIPWYMIVPLSLKRLPRVQDHKYFKIRRNTWRKWKYNPGDRETFKELDLKKVCQDRLTRPLPQDFKTKDINEIIFILFTIHSTDFSSWGFILKRSLLREWIFLSICCLGQKVQWKNKQMRNLVPAKGGLTILDKTFLGFFTF